MVGYYETAGTAVKRVLDKIKIYREGGCDATSGIQTGYQQLDCITGGFHQGELVVIAGRPAMGKTALALNIARSLSVIGDKSVGFLSLEDGKDGIAEKLLTMESTVDFTYIRSKDLSEQNMKALEESADRIEQAKLIVSDCPNPDISAICSICDGMKKEQDIQILFIDYAQLIRAHGESSGELEMTSILSELKGLACRLQIAVVLLSQLSREVDERSDHRPTITDFPVKEVVEFMADTILFVYRDDYYNLHSDMKGIAEIIVTKHDNSRAGTAKLMWNPLNYQFCEFC